MKTLKQENNVKKVRTIIISLVVIAIIGIIVGIILNNRVYAASCPDCGITFTKAKVMYIDSTYHGWYYYCTKCNQDWGCYATTPHSPSADNCSYCRKFL